MPRARSRRERVPGPPDFIGVGGEGPGTDWWHAALVAHRQIEGPSGGAAALHFFDGFCTREMRDADVAGYHGRFPRRAGAISGEWTGRYMCDGWVPTLLHRAAPDARLLVMLGDPIERYRTVFAERMASRVDDKRLRMTDVVDRACHATQLERLGRYYDPDRILVLQLERCLQDPVAEYRRTLRFLGIADEAVPGGLRASVADGGGGPVLGRRRGVPDAPRPEATEPLWPELEAALHATLDPEVQALRALVPELDVRLWPNFAGLA